MAKVLILTTFSKVLMSHHVLEMRLCTLYFAPYLYGGEAPPVSKIQNSIYIASFKGYGVTSELLKMLSGYELLPKVLTLTTSSDDFKSSYVTAQ